MSTFFSLIALPACVGEHCVVKADAEVEMMGLRCDIMYVFQSGRAVFPPTPTGTFACRNCIDQ